jgi:hypothetical protein
VKLVCGSATGGERKHMKNTLTGRVWQMAQKKAVCGTVKSRGSRSFFFREGALSFFQGTNMSLP